MKKPADRLCQRAALPISLAALGVRPLTRHPEAEMVMMMVVCQRARHKLKDYRSQPELSIRILQLSIPQATAGGNARSAHACGSNRCRLLEFLHFDWRFRRNGQCDGGTPTGGLGRLSATWPRLSKLPSCASSGL